MHDGLIDCLLADMDCLDCPVGACSRERAMQTEGVGGCFFFFFFFFLEEKPYMSANLANDSNTQQTDKGNL